MVQAQIVLYSSALLISMLVFLPLSFLIPCFRHRIVWRIGTAFLCSALVVGHQVLICYGWRDNISYPTPLMAVTTYFTNLVFFTLPLALLIILFLICARLSRSYRKRLKTYYRAAINYHRFLQRHKAKQEQKGSVPPQITVVTTNLAQSNNSGANSTLSSLFIDSGTRQRKSLYSALHRQDNAVSTDQTGTAVSTNNPASGTLALSLSGTALNDVNNVQEVIAHKNKDGIFVREGTSAEVLRDARNSIKQSIARKARNYINNQINHLTEISALKSSPKRAADTAGVDDTADATSAVASAAASDAAACNSVLNNEAAIPVPLKTYDIDQVLPLLTNDPLMQSCCLLNDTDKNELQEIINDELEFAAGLIDYSARHAVPAATVPAAAAPVAPVATTDLAAPAAGTAATGSGAVSSVSDSAGSAPPAQNNQENAADSEDLSTNEVTWSAGDGNKIKFTDNSGNSFVVDTSIYDQLEYRHKTREKIKKQSITERSTHANALFFGDSDLIAEASAASNRYDAMADKTHDHKAVDDDGEYQETAVNTGSARRKSVAAARASRLLARKNYYRNHKHRKLLMFLHYCQNIGPWARGFGVSLFLMLAACAGISTFLALSLPPVKTITISLDLPQSFDGMQIVQLSDLNIGGLYPQQRAIDITRKVTQLHPDMIILTGNIANGDASVVLQRLQPVFRLQAPLGVYAVTNAHMASRLYLSMVNYYRSKHFYFLNNEQVSIPIGQYNISITGIIDQDGPLAGFLSTLYYEKISLPRIDHQSYPVFRNTMNNMGSKDKTREHYNLDTNGKTLLDADIMDGNEKAELRRNKLRRIINTPLLQYSDFNLLISNNPNEAMVYDEISNSSFDLMLAGNTYGGGALLTRSFLANEHNGFINGLYEISKRMKLYVSPGTNSWSPLPIRLGATPEITHIIIQSIRQQKGSRYSQKCKQLLREQEYQLETRRKAFKDYKNFLAM